MLAFVKSSDGTTWYQVRVGDGSRCTCTCPHFIFRKQSCKHIDQVRNAPRKTLEQALADIDWEEEIPMYKMPSKVG